MKVVVERTSVLRLLKNVLINEYTLWRNDTNKGKPYGYTKGQVLCFTLDPRMVTLPQVPEDLPHRLTSLMTLKSRIFSDGRRHLKSSRHQTWHLPKTWSMSQDWQGGQSQKLQVCKTSFVYVLVNGGQPFTVVETTRTCLPDTVTTHSSLLGNTHHVLTCRTFVLSDRSSTPFSEGQVVVGQLDSSSLHGWNTDFTSKD